jgi:NSS family neurotransmitter:Na+ symporter
MFFAAMSTIIAVFENILAMLREITGWSRLKGCIIAGALIFVLSLPCALGFNLLSSFEPFASGSGVLDLEDFLVSNCCLPLGSFCYVLFCVSKKGWGFDRFLEEANTGKGLKMPHWLKPYLTYAVPLFIVALFLIGIVNFEFADGFTILGKIRSLF